MSKESLSLYAICKWWPVCINSDHEYNLKIQICQGKKGEKKNKASGTKCDPDNMKLRGAFCS